VPRPIKRAVIRAEGRRRHYGGDGLDDFVEILTAIDDGYVAEAIKAIDKKAKADAAKAGKGNRGEK